MLHFAVKHMGMITDDIRFTTLLDMLFERFHNVPFDFVFTTIWSLGILVSMRGAEIPTEVKLHILKELEGKKIPDHTLPNIPSLIFSISCMMFPNELNDEVYAIIREISEHYVKEGIELMEPIHCSLLLLGFCRLQYHNIEVLKSLCKIMKKPRFFFDCAEQDLINIFNSLADLHHKDVELVEVIHNEVLNKIDDMKTYNV